jgi:hypothetical protein
MERRVKLARREFLIMLIAVRVGGFKRDSRESLFIFVANILGGVPANMQLSSIWELHTSRPDRFT